MRVSLCRADFRTQLFPQTPASRAVEELLYQIRQDASYAAGWDELTKVQLDKPPHLVP